MRADGGRLSPDAERLLIALHRAAETLDGSARGTTPAAPGTVDTGEEAAPAPLTTGQAADILGCSRRLVRRLAAAGRLRAFRLGRDWLIDPGTLDDYRFGRENSHGRHHHAGRAG
ncbi:helix-turn-helix domain-containing protein [Streptomyces aidingensis]|uniref:DNA binding domain-containing protein, excisionase family n=1 Tax=Streptomyces aidingensis TaxID=910347 RepID=A0A1I1TZG9_9ACTN|nr:helix-turn-helix domain-containing protein [Streptomyces aidingensis]SFD61803.1 DNA binding domain-containing protein, excisionase family [Streptomyces aidingensis]